jgi:hypothetical protein
MGVGLRVGSGVGSEVGSRLGKGVGSRVGSGVGSGVGNRVGSAGVGGAFGDRLSRPLSKLGINPGSKRDSSFSARFT